MFNLVQINAENPKWSDWLNVSSSSRVPVHPDKNKFVSLPKPPF